VSAGMLQSRFAVTHPIHGMPFNLETLLQKQTKCTIIFHYQNTHTLGPRSCTPGSGSLHFTLFSTGV
jgi:hypothetical protein